MSKHTKGPWKFNSGNKFIESGEVDICSLNFNPFDDADLANANLIAAAPELLEALNALMSSTDLNLDEGIDQTTLDAMELAKKAIAKAEGNESSPLREALDDIYDPKCPSCNKPTKRGDRCAECYQDYLDHLNDVRENR